MKNIKVITGVITTLGIFSALLLVTGILFYSTVSSDRLNFQNASALSYQQQELAAVFRHWLKPASPLTAWRYAC
ncbi:methyl-accepting chemotaxis citrate transducer [Salmonella enterica subsp. arizonae]|uniref:Methyl-accepting chemotaxis citrate transducer n=1 Tax=Salmonella enterica subsp. arizonae TaxID=59203 RepID=A0A379SN49_SALER|nr:methyl-accepting chemotaxis citrate transducer [Salmonella enterica subsp. arizonae]